MRFTPNASSVWPRVYDGRCASCHQADLRGLGEAPPLSGTAFRTRWLDANIENLGAYIQSSMPPGGNRLTANDSSLNVTAFLALINRPLNGASPAPAALTPPTVANSGPIAHFDHIAYLHRPLEKKNQARNEIIEDILYNEADADAECTGQDSELGHVGAECGDCDIDSHQQHAVVHEGRDCVGGAARELKTIVDFFFEEKTQQTREKQRDPDGENEGHDRA